MPDGRFDSGTAVLPGGGALPHCTQESRSALYTSGVSGAPEAWRFRNTCVAPSSTPAAQRVWNCYLAGEIHTDWREIILEGAKALELPVEFRSGEKMGFPWVLCKRSRELTTFTPPPLFI